MGFRRRKKLSEDPAYGSTAVETISLSTVDERPVRLEITDGDLKIIVGCAPGERDTMTFTPEQFAALWVRVVHGQTLLQ